MCAFVLPLFLAGCQDDEGGVEVIGGQGALGAHYASDSEREVTDPDNGHGVQHALLDESRRLLPVDEDEEGEMHLTEDGVLDERPPSLEWVQDWQHLDESDRAVLLERGHGPHSFDPEQVRQQADQRALARLLAETGELDPDEEVDVLVRIHYDGDRLPRLRDLEREERRSVIDERLERVQTQTEELREVLDSVGGQVLSMHWLVPSVVVRIRAGLIEDLVAHERVRNAALARDEETTSYRGGEHRVALRVDGLISASISGGGYTTGGEPIRLGIMEAGTDNWLRTSGSSFHVALRRPWLWALVPTVQRHRRCLWNDPCENITGQPQVDHGQVVTSVAAGSLQNGQDPNCVSAGNCNADHQLRRSGVAPHVNIYYYNARGASGRIHALEEMVDDAVEVVNMSIGYGNPQQVTGNCELYDHTEDFHEELREAFMNEGVLFVAASGNGTTLALAEQNHCNIFAPATSQYTVAVGGLNSSNVNTDWDDLLPHVLAGGGSLRFGGVPGLKIAGSSTVRYWVALDLLAPSHRSHTQSIAAISGSNAYLAGPSGGSSLSSPAVAGAAALMIEGYRDRGWAESPQRMMGLLFLGADRSTFSFSTQNGVQELSPSSWGPNASSGFGRARAFAGQSAGWPGPWSVWSPRERNVTQGNTWIRQVNGGQPIPSNTPEYRVVAYWFDEDLTASSDATLEVRNTCPSGGGPPVYIAGDGSYNPRKRAVVFNATGMCLEVRVHAYVAPSGGLDFWVGDLRFGSGP